MALVQQTPFCIPHFLPRPDHPCVASYAPTLAPRLPTYLPTLSPPPDVPKLGSVANATSAAAGGAQAQRRNATTRAQTEPPRTAGFYTSGAVAIDVDAASALSAGFSASVAKNVGSTYGAG